MFDKLSDFVSPLYGNSLTITENDYINAAKRLNLPEVAIIKAVVEVESNGSGFYNDGRPKILFEAHVFNRLTNGKFLNTPFSKNPSKKIAVAAWDKSNYPSTSQMYDILLEAIALDKEAALKSASWNLMQILGSNYKACGAFDSVESFVASQIINEGKSLEAFSQFVLANRIDDELRIKNWAGFAYVYNGKGYRRNRYDERLAAAYAKHSKIEKRAAPVAPTTSVTVSKRAAFTGVKSFQIKNLQKWLNSNTSLPIRLVEDGNFGRKTDEAVELAVLQHGAPVIRRLLNIIGLNTMPI